MVVAMDARIKLALEIIRRKLEERVSVTDLARLLGLSPSRFEHLFKAETGRTFRAYTQDTRLKKVSEMLRDPTLRVKEVAAATGYSYARNLTRDYRKRCGRSPSQSRTSSE